MKAGSALGKKPGPLIDWAAISTELSKRERSYAALASEGRFILEQRIDDEGIKIHAIESRVKTQDSIIKKCTLNAITKPFDDLVDIVGLRIICLFRSDLEIISEIIQNEFNIHSIDDKVMADVESFGYMSVHYVVSLKDSLSGPRYEKIKGIKFEIQVRTLAMHAWAAISHYLAYKGEWDVPDNLKKSLNALSGLFYLADGEFERFYIESNKSRTAAGALEKSDEINLDTIRALLVNQYPDREQPNDDDLSELVREIKLAGYEKLSIVKSDLDRASHALSVYETSSPSIFEKRVGYFAAVGAARISLTIASEVFENGRGPEDEEDYSPYRVYLQ
jgi:putative GTP pyrophosphokinase